MTGFKYIRCLGLLATMVMLLPASLASQDEDERETGWFYTAELSFVLTGGNAESNTLGTGAGINRVRDRSQFSLTGGGLRTESSMTTRVAVGTSGDFEVVENTDSELTAEKYFARARYDFDVSERFFLYGGTGWERNTFAGFDNRFSVVAGIGNIWADGENTRFRTGYGFTYTAQDDVVDDPDASDSFAGLRGNADFWQKISESAALNSVFVVDESLNDTEDLRGDWTNSLTLSISDNLAVRTSLQLLFDNLPSLTTVPLEAPAGTPTGESVLVPLDELDSIFTVALVASF